MVFAEAPRRKRQRASCPVYLALGIQRDGTKEVLGIWIQQSEGAKFWLGIMNELHHRGLKDILVAVIDGLKGFPEAISAVYPDSEIQTCIVHLIRNSLSFCNWKDRRPVAAELKKIYNAETAELAAKRLEDFEQGAFGTSLNSTLTAFLSASSPLN